MNKNYVCKFMSGQQTAEKQYNEIKMNYKNMKNLKHFEMKLHAFSSVVRHVPGYN
jgi:hypothetical protein